MSEIKFGLTLPQSWIHDLADSPPTQQFEYSKKIAVAAGVLGSMSDKVALYCGIL